MPSQEQQYHAALLLLRILVGGLMLFHGIHKIIGPAGITGIENMLAAKGLPKFIAYGVYIGEVLAPLLIILGICTRPAAWVLVVNMLFAVILVHASHFLLLTGHGGWRLELQAFYLFGGVIIALLGSGKWALKPDKR